MRVVHSGDSESEFPACWLCAGAPHPAAKGGANLRKNWVMEVVLSLCGWKCSHSYLI